MHPSIPDNEKQELIDHAQRRRDALERMWALREKAIKNGMELLNEDQLHAEIARRRGEYADG